MNIVDELREETSGDGFPVLSPFNGEELCTVRRDDLRDVERALVTAFALFRDREQWISVAERIAVLRRSIVILVAQSEELARLIALEGGKPLMDAKVEVSRALEGIQYAVDRLRGNDDAPPEFAPIAGSADRVAVLLREPIGVVAAISAFNHPLNLIVHQVIPAVAAGCPVVVKPSPETPLSCMKLVKVLAEAGMPDGWCSAIVTDDTSVAEALATDSRIGLLSFVGSAAVGWKLRSRVAPGVRCVLEHGGAAPVIIGPGTEPAGTLPSIAKGAFYHAGQVCVSVQRIYAPEDRARDLALSLATVAGRMIIGDPVDAKTEVGPLIRPEEVDRIGEWVQEAVEGGGELLCGGTSVNPRMFPPTVLFNPPPDASVSRREVFGPVACVYPYARMSDALNAANSLPFAFQAAVFSSWIDDALYLASRLDASAVMVNDHSAFRIDNMPFAGLRQSGLGVGGISHTMDEMQVKKMVVLRSSSLAS